MFDHPPIIKFALEDGLDSRFLPTKAHEKDTGFDVCCAEPDGVLLDAYEYASISLGFRAFISPGWWLELKPRSSSFIKKNLHCLYGTIDEEYSGLMKFCCQYLPEYKDDKLFIDFGERIGQIIPVRRQTMIVEEVSNKEMERLIKERNAKRGSGGFGSTGN